MHRRNYLEENVAAVSLPLAADEVVQLDNALSAEPVSGRPLQRAHDGNGSSLKTQPRFPLDSVTGDAIASSVKKQVYLVTANRTAHILYCPVTTFYYGGLQAPYRPTRSACRHTPPSRQRETRVQKCGGRRRPAPLRVCTIRSREPTERLH
jgi:hypothetical protein